VLTRGNRLTASRLFAPTIRRGTRAGSRTLVVHLAVPFAVTAPATPPVVGFVVSKAVGGAVVRNQVKRRLRHLARERLSSLPGSAVLVVRALPPAADASFAELGADLDRVLGRVLRTAVGGDPGRDRDRVAGSRP
jgi:ribonuclease P protein component